MRQRQWRVRGLSTTVVMAMVMVVLVLGFGLRQTASDER
jgi:hypothetical protein